MQGKAGELAKCNVLIVDGYSDTTKSYAILFTVWGYGVRTACDARSANEVTADFSPNVALIDLALPEMSAIALARRLHARFAGIKLIAVTTLATDQERKEVTAAGFYEYLLKPINIEKLQSVMESARAN